MDPLRTHANYLQESLKLMVCYVSELTCRREPPVPIDEALELRTDILRRTVHFDGRHPAYSLEPANAAWDGLRAQLAERIFAHADVADTDALETECWTILQPLVEPIAREHYERSLQDGQGPYQCWSFDTRANAPGAIPLHVRNAYRPASPFSAAHRPQLVERLLRLLHDAQAAHPAATRLRCGSWLNQLPPFLSLFPPSWSASFVASDYSSGTYGHWGQYMDHRGAFHLHNGAALRRTGRHPYAAGTCQCDIAEVIRHLREQSV